MSSLFALLVSAGAIGLAAGATPGALQTFIVSETLSGGWRRSWPLIFVPLLSDAPVILLTTFLLGRMPSGILRGISILGGLFVLYLAWGLWQQWRKPQTTETVPEAPTQFRGLWKAITMNLLNPNPYIFWAFVLGPLLLSAIEQSWLHALAFLLGFYGSFMITMLGLIALFHFARRLGPRAIRGIQLISIVILLTFGGILLRDGFLG